MMVDHIRRTAGVALVLLVFISSGCQPGNVGEVPDNGDSGNPAGFDFTGEENPNNQDGFDFSEEGEPENSNGFEFSEEEIDKNEEQPPAVVVDSEDGGTIDPNWTLGYLPMSITCPEGTMEFPPQPAVESGRIEVIGNRLHMTGLNGTQLTLHHGIDFGDGTFYSGAFSGRGIRVKVNVILYESFDGVRSLQGALLREQDDCSIRKEFLGAPEKTWNERGFDLMFQEAEGDDLSADRYFNQFLPPEKRVYISDLTDQLKQIGKEVPDQPLPEGFLDSIDPGQP